MYLTYQEYVSYGGTLNSTQFDRLSYRAGKAIQAHTFGRVDAMAVVPEAVKRLEYELINIEQNTQNVRNASSGAVKSFSTDGYSETYDEAMSAESIDDMEAETIRYYLLEEVDDNNVPLLYKGVEA